MQKMQYAFVELADNGDYEPVLMSHQDDLENAIVADSLEGLLDDISTWADMDASDVVDGMVPGGEFEKYRIVRQPYEYQPLTTDDMADLYKACGHY